MYIILVKQHFIQITFKVEKFEYNKNSSIISGPSDQMRKNLNEIKKTAPVYQAHLIK